MTVIEAKKKLLKKHEGLIIDSVKSYNGHYIFEAYMPGEHLNDYIEDPYYAVEISSGKISYYNPAADENRSEFFDTEPLRIELNIET